MDVEQCFLKNTVESQLIFGGHSFPQVWQLQFDPDTATLSEFICKVANCLNQSHMFKAWRV